MLASHHSHSGQFCRHAVGTLEEVVKTAIAAGFKVYGLTEHVPRYRREDLYPEETNTEPADLAHTFDLYLKEAHRLKVAYAAQITLLVGLETDFITFNDLDQLEALLVRYSGQIEYVVGSVHHCNGIPIDFDKATFEKSVASFADTPSTINDKAPTPTQISYLNAYFDAQLQLMERIHPEVIGHFDVCRLYTPNLSLRAVWPRVERNVKYAIEYGAVFELNAAAFRKEWDSAYPGREIVELIKSLGGGFVLSDDSHGPAAVGLNYDRLLSYVQEMSIKKVAHLETGTQCSKSGRQIHPVIFPAIRKFYIGFLATILVRVHGVIDETMKSAATGHGPEIGVYLSETSIPSLTTVAAALLAVAPSVFAGKRGLAWPCSLNWTGMQATKDSASSPIGQLQTRAAQQGWNTVFSLNEPDVNGISASDAANCTFAQFQSHVQNAHNRFPNYQLVVSEFALVSPATRDQQVAFLKSAMSFLDGASYVAMHSVFSASSPSLISKNTAGGEVGTGSSLFNDDGSLSANGIAYRG
ncbi:histidinolphosphatase [Ceratobasidium sp. 395]|nr:histidinolphosphatase [Ceratobasidium sp. 395]